ncbi:VRR-NUC domain-containing protein [Microbulbifer thermotolerans]|uniref:VRR-NUC domain-containing protein n=1 Tax=Microbulbifer thermotolerans TaxID=252514 RepID=UPI0008E6FA80|nr:VRR-NUC domain-containing protein [Microbulbifer thermotolerans]SFB85652.1 VRR-NUC domain-containing protein [Microbulbifer thermotolerans]
MPSPAELKPDYYLTNFQTLVDFVMKRYQHLLSEKELAFRRRLETLDINSRRLFVRLLLRKGVPSSAGALFRQDKLNYAEIQHLPRAVVRLIDAGLLQRNPKLPVEAYLPLYNRAELAALSPIPLPRSLKRQALVRALLEQSPQPLNLQEALSRFGPVLAVQKAEHFKTFRLLFFGNLSQDLSEFVLRDLGLYRYEPYPLEQRHLPFRSRAQVEQHLLYYQCQEELGDALDKGKDAILALAERLPSGIDGDAALQRRLDRLRLSLARQLERLEALEDAERLYRLCTHPPAKERRARIAVKRGDIENGLALCREILATPCNEAERIFAERFGHRTAKNTVFENDWPPPTQYRPPAQTIRLPKSLERVELLVMKHLEKSDGGCCYYVENNLLSSVLGLYCWDIVFKPIPGAFYNPFQAEPGDFRTADFYPSRQWAFDRRLAELNTETLTQRVWRCYREKRGITNPLVIWQALSDKLLQLALTHIPVPHWYQLFRRFLADITHHRNGLPDLILFPESGGYRLLEVKGPGDRLQPNQLRWLTFFAQHQIPHRVLHVEWQ